MCCTYIYYFPILKGLNHLNQITRFEKYLRMFRSNYLRCFLVSYCLLLLQCWSALKENVKLLIADSSTCSFYPSKVFFLIRSPTSWAKVISFSDALTLMKNYVSFTVLQESYTRITVVINYMNTLCSQSYLYGLVELTCKTKHFYVHFSCITPYYCITVNTTVC